MEDSERIPPAEFAATLAALDPTELAAFVADVYRGVGEEVDLDPPVVTVQTDEDPVRLQALADGAESPPLGVDAVVTADPESVPDKPSIGPADLRQRLLYALSPGEADELCEQYLGRPARSAEYAPAAPVETGPGEASPGAAGDGGQDGGRGESVRPQGTAGESLAGTPLAPLVERVGPQVVLVGLLALVVVATSAGAVFVGSLVSDGGDVLSSGVTGAGEDGAAGTPSGTNDSGATGASTGVNDGGVTTPAGTEGRDWGGWEAIPHGLPNSGETPTPTPTPTSGGDGAVRALGADRYADLRPTCNRSFLHVVQIQMNALKYNDNETNDGIRTVRRFASPRNREAIGPLSQYIRLIESETYAPMLSYDSAEYEPWRFATDTADVGVTLRTDGNVTARYSFRMAKQDGGEYDGCWMTQGVRPVTDRPGPSGN